MNYIVKALPFDYSTYKEIIEGLIKKYSFLSVNVIGRTALDRGIFSLEIGNSKNSVLYAAGFCGDEGLTSLMTLLFVERVCHSISEKSLLCGVDIGKALTQLGITVVPCVNPDGLEIFRHGEGSAKALRRFVGDMGSTDSWKANALGVDIRQNFSKGGDKTKASPEGYGGEYAESEAETKALTRLCRLMPFRQVMALHKGDNRLLWQYEGAPSHCRMMSKILSASCGCVSDIPLSEEKNQGLSSWFAQRFKRPAFSLETDSAETDLYKLYAGYEEAMVLFSLM